MKFSGGILKSIRLGTLLGILLAISLLATSLPPTVPKALAEGDQPPAQTEKETGQDKKTNQPPAANAGADQMVHTGDVVAMDGSASNDPEGNPLAYIWTFTSQPEGSTATLDDPASAAPKFTADLPGAYVLSLTVNDGELDSEPDTVTVTASAINLPPTANAGADLTVKVGDVVILDGLDSADPEGNPLTYTWKFDSRPEGSGADLDDPTSTTPKFTADLPGPYILSLLVSDGDLSSDPDSVMVMVLVDESKDNAVEQEPPLEQIGTAKMKVRPDQDAELESESKKIKLKISKNSLNEEADIEVIEHGQWGPRKAGLLNVFELNAFATQRSNAKVKQFQKQLQLTIQQDPSELAGMDIDSLKLCYLDEQTKQWVRVADSKFDKATNIITASTNHFSFFAVQVNPAMAGPGQILASQVGLQSGTAMYSYPIELPPGSGGFTPSVTLTYNSGIADEMKNRRDVGSWVGIGWTLHLGRISYDPSSNEYYLDLNGACQKLAQGDDGATYYTSPDSFYKITRNVIDNSWTMYDTEGKIYTFGGTNDSKQFYDNTTYYRWDLNSIQDTNSSNAITISYVQDELTLGGTTHVRSAYPSHVKYNNDHVDIEFISSLIARIDNPTSCDFNPVPKATETGSLASINVKVDGSLVRMYSLAYNTVPSEYYPDEYGGICYAGTHTLTSIIQKDENDDLALPTMMFTYENKQTYLHDPDIPDYIGNPGNPATFNWPHLTGISSGYGANSTYTYVQSPDPLRDDMWSRQVVREKTVDSGIGPVQTITYNYASPPTYFKVGNDDWEAEFRGFNWVRETDAAGNDVYHSFYTGGDADGEKLTGLEYETEWYSASGTLLRKVTNDWKWRDTAQVYKTLRNRLGYYSSMDGLFQSPFGIALSPDGYVYVADTNNSRIQKFNPGGALVSSWGTWGSDDGQFKSPRGLAVSADNYVYVADSSNQRIQKFTSEGDFVTTWGSRGSGDGQFYSPDGISVGSDGYVYVADTSNNRIQKFTSEGDFVTTWGSRGSGDGQFYYPNGISVGSDGYVYVADTYNDRIQKFTSSGAFVTKWGGIYDPMGISAESDGYVYVADCAHRIVKFTSLGALVGSWGSQGGGDGQFNYPYGISVGSDGYVYVADTSNNRIQKFTSSGTFVTKWGGLGLDTTQGYYPQSISMGEDGNVYSTEKHSGVITVLDAHGASSGTYSTGQPYIGDGWGNCPSDIFGKRNWYVYAADTLNNRVLKISYYSQGPATWGSAGSGDGQFLSPSGISLDNSDNVYVADTGNHRIQKFTSYGTFITKWGSMGTGDGQFQNPQDLFAASDGYIYVTDTGNNRIQKFTSSGDFVVAWGSSGSGDGQFESPEGICVSSDGYVYIADTGNNRIQKFTSSGAFVAKWGSYGSRNDQFDHPEDICVGNDGYVYVANTNNKRIQSYTRLYTTYLNKIEETVGSKTSRTRYVYDDYNNLVTEYYDGDISTGSDDSTIYRTFNPNTTANILSKPARERVYSGIQATDDGGANLKSESLYYYDGNNTSNSTPPTVGNLTCVESKKDTSNSVSAYYTYDSYGNVLTETDPNNNTWTTTWDSTYHAYPVIISSPVSGQSESYTFDPGTSNLLTLTGVNGQTTTYKYDTFNRLVRVFKPGDYISSPYNPDDPLNSPSLQYDYTAWGTLNQQNVKTLAKVAEGDYLWSSQYFDGIGRVIQTQSRGESGHTIIDSTTTFNNRGLVDKTYVSQDIASVLTQYYAPVSGWKYSTSVHDGLGRVTSATAADGTTTSIYYLIPWQQLVTNERGNLKRYTNNAFGQLVTVEEFDASQSEYATTNYTYDTLGNLAQVRDNSSNTTSMTYDWLSRKTGMVDPDMGAWSYGYDNNGNLTSQTDAKGQTITLSYDALNRLTGKTYPAGSGMTDIAYTYDDVSGGNFGKGRRTSMTDAAGVTTYQYNAKGQLIEEKRTIDAVDYVTGFAYDAGDRLATVTYPTGETVTQAYSERGLPNTLSGSVVGNLVTGMTYNQLGEVTQINLGNNAQTIYGYWDVGGANDTTGGYYGNLWKIQTSKSGTDLQNATHTWDAGGNLTQRTDSLTSETETFGYDFLDRLISVSGAYSQSYSYNQIGNITSMNGSSYTYGTKPHAVTAVGALSYFYDNNGNMTTRSYRVYAVSGLNLTNGGSGYTSAPTVSITGGGGSGAIGTASLTATRVASFNITNGGSGYTSAPTVSITGGGGSGATAEATLMGTSIASLNITNGGSGYTSVPTVNITGGGGSGAAATAIMAAAPVSTIIVTNGGSGYTSVPTVIISGGGGSGATAAAALTPTAVGSLNLTSGGSGYTSAPAVSISGGGSGATGTTTLTATSVASLNLTNGGSGYTSVPTVTLSGGSGSGATGTATLVATSVASINVTNGGNNYTSVPSVNISGGGGSGATAVATVSKKKVTAITVTNHGSGYISVPTVTISGGGGSGATAIAALTPTAVGSLNRTSGGSGYTSAPTVSISGGGGSGATGTSTLTATSVASLNLTNGGSGYTSVPTVTLSGGGGSGATGTATLMSTSIASINVTSGGNGYTSVPSVNISGGGGSGATATAILAPAAVGSLNLTNGGSGYTSAPNVGFSGGGGSGTAAIAVLAATGVASLTLYNSGIGYTSSPVVNITGGGGTGAAAAANLTPTTVAGLSLIDGGNGYTSVPSVTISGGGGSGATATATIVPLSQTITWDVENKPVSISGGATFVYDGDGNRIKKTEAGETTLYINQFYDKNLTTSEVTSHYFLGGKEIAFRKGPTLEYLHTDHLGSTSVTTNASGAQVGKVAYFPFGSTRSTIGTLDTKKLFTGQRLDDTGLYFYNARYYDATIGRFISPDTIVPNPANPQSLNRYSYCRNNPLNRIDPSGHGDIWAAMQAAAAAITAAHNAGQSNAAASAAGSQAGWAVLKPTPSMGYEGFPTAIPYAPLIPPAPSGAQPGEPHDLLPAAVSGIANADKAVNEAVKRWDRNLNENIIPNQMRQIADVVDSDATRILGRHHDDPNLLPSRYGLDTITLAPLRALAANQIRTGANDWEESPAKWAVLDSPVPGSLQIKIAAFLARLFYRNAVE